MRRWPAAVLGAVLVSSFVFSAVPASAGTVFVSRPSPRAGRAHARPGRRTLAALARRDRFPRYTVQRGDTLSSIAARHGLGWPGLFAANRRHIGLDPDVITRGEKLILRDAPVRGWVAGLVWRVMHPPAPKPARHETAAAAAASPGEAAGAPSSSPAAWSGGYPGGAFGACVVARESGGNAEIMNASGHWGLYQFSEATWVAYGGSAADFGSAGAAEQNQVFANALAQGGQSNWSPYDGCL